MSSLSPAAPRFPWSGLLALAVASFLSISGEMLPTGLLPEMGAELRVSGSSVGLLVSVFAFTVVFTSPILTHLFSRIPRHRLLVLVIVVLAVSAFSTALAPNYGLLVAARVLGGLAHGVYWAIAGAYAAHLVPREQVGRALAVSSSGGTLAFVFGVQVGTALGQVVGWRLAFGVLAVLMIFGAVLVWKQLPDVGSAAGDAELLRQEATAAGSGATPVGPGALATGSIPVIENGAAPGRHPVPSVLGVVFTCIITGVFMIGHYALYTYIAPFLTGSSGIAEGSLSVSLFAYGVAGAIGLALVGWFLGRRPAVSLPVIMGLVALSVLGLLLFEGRALPSLFVFVALGVFFGAIPPLLQTRLLEMAPARIRDVANSFFTTAFNAGIGTGALLGGVVLSGAGLGALPRLYVVIAIAVLAATILSNWVLLVRQRRQRSSAWTRASCT